MNLTSLKAKLESQISSGSLTVSKKTDELTQILAFLESAIKTQELKFNGVTLELALDYLEIKGTVSLFNQSALVAHLTISEEGDAYNYSLRVNLEVTKALQLPGLNIINMSIIYNRHGGDQVTGSISGKTSLFGKTDLEISIPLPVQVDEWCIMGSAKNIMAPDVKQLAQWMKMETLVEFLPGGFGKISNLSISSFGFLIKPYQNELKQSTVEISCEKLELTPSLSVENILAKIQITNPLSPTDALVYCQFSGALSLDGTQISITIANQLYGSNWRLSMDNEFFRPLPDLNNLLVTITGNEKILAAAPTFTKQIKGVRIESLNATINPKELKLLDFEIALNTAFPFAGQDVDASLRLAYSVNQFSFLILAGRNQPLSIRKIWSELASATPLPFEWDLQLHNLKIEITSSYDEDGTHSSIRLEGAVSYKHASSDGLESCLSFDKIALVINKKGGDNSQREIEINIYGKANLNDEINIESFSLDYCYKYDQASDKSEWSIEGSLHILAFQRLMAFTARAASLKEEQNIAFTFENTDLILHADYFNQLKELAPENILKDLNGGVFPEKNQLSLSKLAPDAVEKLGKNYTAEQKTKIAEVIKLVQKANEPLVTIPDFFNEGKMLCAVSPQNFKLELTRKNNRFESIDFAIGSNLVIYNPLDDSGELFNMKNGVVSTGYHQSKKLFYLKFSAEKTEFKPLNAIALIPVVMKSLRDLFGEKADHHPKTTAFASMLEIQPQDFSFIKNGTNWQLSGKVRLVLNDGLSVVDKSLYDFLEQLFPKAGDIRFIEGGVSYDSKNGLFFVLENNSGIVIPNLLKNAADAMDAKFKSEFKQKTGIDLDTAMNLGDSFFILDRARLKIAKDIKFDVRIGLGLPSNLNDRLFNRNSKIHGLINTYDHEKYKIAHQKKDVDAVEYDKTLPDDNLIRATLTVGTDGIGGQLDKFNVFNVEKITKEFEGFYEENNGSITLDFKALTKDPEKDKEYLKLKIEKITFKLDIKTCAFNVGGGIHLLSDAFTIPVKPLLKKLIAILPLDAPAANKFNQFAENFSDSIALKSMHFYDAKNKVLSVDDLVNFIKQFLPVQQQNIELIPKEITQLFREHSSKIAEVLPEMLLDYLSIKIPAGLKFNLEIPADKSVSFALEVSEPTETKGNNSYSEYLQFLFPSLTSLIGLRIKKIGLGSGLFNQAIRLDLSGEMVMFDYLQTIPGIGLGLLRNSNPNDIRLQQMAPDVKIFGYKYKLENLLMLIFPQATVPIPVPVFYDEFSVYAAGLEGSKSEFSIKFPRPQINIVELFKGIGDVVNFFKTKEFALPVASYGVARKNDEKPTGSFPAFYAGPMYVELPGILGYEKLAGNERTKITLGFKEEVGANAKDILALVANSVKFGAISIAEKKYHKIKIDETRSEYPVNYLVKFFPASQRIGSKSIVLFDILDANFAWALSTPAEFKDIVFPLLVKEQEANRVAVKGNSWAADELLAIIPKSDQWDSDQDGAVVFLKGCVKISDTSIMEAVTATAITSKNGFATGLSIRASLTDIFDLGITGGMQIRPDSKDDVFSLAGKSHLLILGNVPVMKGAFSMGIGAQSQFRFDGLLDLFPDELFDGKRSPIQFYTGTKKGDKSNVTGTIDSKGINIGYYNADGSISEAGLHLEIGQFYLAGTTRIVTTSIEQRWDASLMLYETKLLLSAGTQTIPDVGKELWFGISANQAIGIEGFLKLSGTQENSGPSGRLALLYRDKNLFPELTEFYLDGQIDLFGLKSSTKLRITQEAFITELGTKLGNELFNAQLRLSGHSFADANSFNLQGKVDLLNKLVSLDVKAFYYKTTQKAMFKGKSHIEIFGSGPLALDLEMSSNENNAFELSGGISHSVSLLNGMLELSNLEQNGQGPRIDITISNSTLTQFKIGGSLNLFGLKDKGFVSYKDQVLIYELSKRWDTDNFKGEMNLSGELGPERLTANTSVLMSLKIGRILKRILSLLPDTDISIEVDLRKFNISIEKDQAPQDRVNKELEIRNAEIKGFLDAAKIEAHAIQEEVETQRSKLSELATEIDKTPKLNPAVAQEYRDTINKLRTDLLSADTRVKVPINEKARYDILFANINAELGKVTNIRNLLTQLDNIGYEWKIDINNNEYWDEARGRKSPYNIKWKDKLAEIQEEVSILLRNQNNAIELSCAQKFASNNIPPDRYRIKYSLKELTDRVNDFQDNIFWRHFLFNAFSDRDNRSKRAKEIEQDLLGQVRLREEFLTQYSQCLASQIKSLEGERDNIKREISDLVKKAYGLRLLVLADIKEITEGNMRADEVLYIQSALSQKGDESMIASTEGKFWLTIDVELFFKKGEGDDEFSLPNLNIHWKEQLNGWESDTNLMDKLPDMIADYMVRNLFDILVYTFGSIAKTVEFIWNYTNKLLMGNPQMSQEFAMPSKFDLASEVLVSQVGFSANENSYNLITNTIKNSL